MPASEIQVDFHRNADRKRFLNRIGNRFLSAKEIAIADRVGSHLPPGGRLLEVGCGEGSNIYWLRFRRPDAQVVGMDFSPSKVAFLADSVEDAAAVCGDATALPFADASFDVVLCRDILHHVNWNRHGVLAEALRVARADGVVVVFESHPRTAFNLIFQAIFPAERGMSDSTPAKVLAQCSRHGPTEFDFVEASFLIRALAFFLGHPGSGLKGRAISAIYSAALLWDRLVSRLVPKRHWVYMSAVLHHPDRPGGAEP